MSMKRTDLEKHQAKKLDGKLKSTLAPQRFGQGSAATSAKAEPKPRDVVVKLVPVACRLPAELLSRIRERAIVVDGGINVIMAQAAELWLQSNPGPAPNEA